MDLLQISREGFDLSCILIKKGHDVKVVASFNMHKFLSDRPPNLSAFGGKFPLYFSFSAFPLFSIIFRKKKIIVINKLVKNYMSLTIDGSIHILNAEVRLRYTYTHCMHTTCVHIGIACVR